MKKHTKRIIFLSIVFILILSIFNVGDLVALAQSSRSTTPLEIAYPDIPGASAPTTTGVDINEYFIYVYYFFIGISGIIALVVIVNAGLSYLTSVGNPEKIKEAKSKISAGLLGLVILFGSYLILYSINPELVVFNVQSLRPLMTELSPGVLLCKKQAPIMRAWDLQTEFQIRTLNEADDITRDEAIIDEMRILLAQINNECYSASFSADIREGFSGEIEYIYFIPYINYSIDSSTGNIFVAGGDEKEYSAIIYSETGFRGESKTFIDHLFTPDQRFVYTGSFNEYNGRAPYEERVNSSDIASIKPFDLIYLPQQDSSVILYESYKENKEVGPGGAQSQPYNCHTSGFWDDLAAISGVPTISLDERYGLWICEENLPWRPKSMKIDGDLLAVLIKPNGESETFTKDTYNNLESYNNIIDWVVCPSFTTSNTRTNINGSRCAQAAASRLIIISGVIK